MDFAQPSCGKTDKLIIQPFFYDENCKNRLLPYDYWANILVRVKKDFIIAKSVHDCNPRGR